MIRGGRKLSFCCFAGLYVYILYDRMKIEVGVERRTAKDFLPDMSPTGSD